MNFAGVFSGIGVDVAQQVATDSFIGEIAGFAGSSFLETLGSNLLQAGLQTGLNIGTGLAIQAIKGDSSPQTVQQALAGQSNPGQPYQQTVPQNTAISQPVSAQNSQALNPNLMLGIGGLVLLAVLLR